MRLFFWCLSMLSLVGVWYASNIHQFLIAKIVFYQMQEASLIQVVLAVLAGIFATKASDSSGELRMLMRVPDIQDLIQKADSAAAKSEREEQRLSEIVALVGHEVEQQFAREMLINHKKQLSFHWEQILKLGSVIEKENAPEGVDPKVKQLIQNYIIKTQYLEYMGKGFLRSIPVLGVMLDYLFGPLWNTFYLKNLPRFNKMAMRNKE